MTRAPTRRWFGVGRAHTPMPQCDGHQRNPVATVIVIVITLVFVTNLVWLGYSLAEAVTAACTVVVVASQLGHRLALPAAARGELV